MKVHSLTTPHKHIDYPVPDDLFQSHNHILQNCPRYQHSGKGIKSIGPSCEKWFNGIFSFVFLCDIICICKWPDCHDLLLQVYTQI